MKDEKAYAAQLLALVEEARPIGFRTTSFGARLYGHVPHVAPEAWLHVLYAGLTEADLQAVAAGLEVSFPDDYCEFLRFFNGLDLFSNSLSLYGKRSSYEREGDAAWQPFAIEVANIQERPAGLSRDHVIVGSYFDDGSKLAIDCKSGKVSRFARGTAGPALTEWPDFWSMLLSEARRISELFDMEGRMIDPKRRRFHPEVDSDQ